MHKDALRPGCTFVTPTRRLAHWLERSHAEACLAAGLEIWRTPEILSWSALLERLFAKDREAGRCTGRWLSDSAARLVWEGIARADPAAEALIAPGQLGRTAFESWRRMHAYRIPLRALDGDDRPEARAFSRWAARYSEWLGRHGWFDESTALERVDPRSVEAPLELVGFDQLTPAQSAFLEKLGRAGVAVTHRAPVERRAEASRVACHDRASELDTAARWAAARMDRDPGVRLAIVVPGLAAARADVRRLVERVLVPGAFVAGGPAPESHAFELASAPALTERPLVAAALEVIDAFSRRADLATASRLLRAPFVGGDAEESDARARLDARIRRSEGFDLGLPRLAELAARHGCPRLAQGLAAGLERVREWPGRALPSRWSWLWAQLLGVMGWPGDRLDSDEHQARQRWQELLAEFGACDDYVGPVGRAEAATLLRDVGRSVLFQPQELDAPLVVIDPDTCAGMDFDGLWVCGLDSLRWPAAASPDPFLPRDWQVKQRMPGATAELAVEDARRVLLRLRRSADEVILSHPMFDDEAQLLPSALVAEFPESVPGELWAPPSPARTAFDARPALTLGQDGVMPPVSPDEAARGGARLLELVSACPFRAQAELRLGARALEEPEAGVAATERGDLVHDVLKRLWDGLRERRALEGLSESGRRRLVRDAVTSAIAAALGSADGVLRHLLALESAWLEKRVHELLIADLARAEFCVEDTEQQRIAGIGGLRLDLRIDRVDRLADGSLAVIDYKTGGEADASAWLGERPRLPQLPLYAVAVGLERVSAVAFGRVRTGESGYAGIARDGEAFPGLRNPQARGWPKDFASWDDLLGAWRRRLVALAEEYARGQATLAPDPVHACRYCHLAGLCRVGESGLAAEAGSETDD